MSRFLTTSSPRSFSLKVVLIFTVIVVDAVATVWLMCQGFGELNPLMHWLAERWSIGGMAIFKIMWSLALMIWLVGVRPFRKYIDWLIIGYFVLYAGGWLIQWTEELGWTQLINGLP